MAQHLAHVAVVVRDYDEAIAFYTNMLDFDLVADVSQPKQNKRWVLVRPKGGGASVLLAQARDDAQAGRIGDQTGGRVFLFLATDDFWRDYRAFRRRGVEFERRPVEAEYGTVAVFRDLYGNLWDLVQFADAPAA